MWIVYICTIYVWNYDRSYDDECLDMVHEDDDMMLHGMIWWW